MTRVMPPGCGLNAARASVRESNVCGWTAGLLTMLDRSSRTKAPLKPGMNVRLASAAQSKPDMRNQRRGKVMDARAIESRSWSINDSEPGGRSEEHTSELQQLMRISY